jgi:hypothetical protein
MIVRRIAFGFMCFMVFALQYSTFRQAKYSVDQAMQLSVPITFFWALSAIYIMKFIVIGGSVNNKYVDMLFRSVFYIIYMIFGGNLPSYIYQGYIATSRGMSQYYFELALGNFLIVVLLVAVFKAAHKYVLAKKAG